MATRNTSLTLGQYPKRMVRVACSRCERKGQYLKETLIDRFGPDVTMLDLLHWAKCARDGVLGTDCGLHYGDFLPSEG